MQSIQSWFKNLSPVQQLKHHAMHLVKEIVAKAWHCLHRLANLLTSPFYLLSPDNTNAHTHSGVGEDRLTLDRSTQDELQEHAVPKDLAFDSVRPHESIDDPELPVIPQTSSSPYDRPKADKDLVGDATSVSIDYLEEGRNQDPTRRPPKPLTNSLPALMLPLRDVLLAPAEIAMLFHALCEARFMLDCVLHVPSFSEELYCAFFKTLEYRLAVTFIFDHVRWWVAHLTDALSGNDYSLLLIVKAPAPPKDLSEVADNSASDRSGRGERGRGRAGTEGRTRAEIGGNTRAQARGRIRAGTGGGGKAGTGGRERVHQFAGINVEHFRLTLGDAFFTEQISINPPQSPSMTDRELALLRSTTLIHELVHLVSYWRWELFLHQAGRVPLQELALDHKLIMDMELVPHVGNRGQVFVSKRRNLQGQRLAFRFVDRRINKPPEAMQVEIISVIGMALARSLAECDLGAVLSLLNAENYACYAATIAGRVWRREARTSP